MSELKSSASILKWMALANAAASTWKALAKLGMLDDICVAIWSIRPAAPALSWDKTVAAISSLISCIICPMACWK